MSKRIIETADAPPTKDRPYSQAVAANGFLFLSGAAAFVQDPESGLWSVPQGLTVAEETRQLMYNARTVLGAAALNLSHVVDVTVFLTDVDRDYEAMNRAYGEYFASQTAPARTCVQGQPPLGFRVEMKFTAAFPE